MSLGGTREIVLGGHGEATFWGSLRKLNRETSQTEARYTFLPVSCLYGLVRAPGNLGNCARGAWVRNVWGEN